MVGTAYGYLTPFPRRFCQTTARHCHESYAQEMRGRETIESELRLLAAVRRSLVAAAIVIVVMFAVHDPRRAAQPTDPPS